MKTLGVTGGIGSGKTAACRLLEERGAEVFYADQEARRLMEQRADVRQDIERAFGADSYYADGSLNAAHLSSVVFGDEAQVERLNAIVHPRVFEAFRERKKTAEEAGVDLLVHEAALIFESGGDRHLDAVAVVDAPEDQRIARVMARDDTTEAAVRARMGHQLAPAELRRRADYVIDNGGSPEDLRAEVARVFEAVRGGA